MQQVGLVQVNIINGENNDIVELEQLVVSAALEPSFVIECHRQAPDATFYVGTGKAHELKELVSVQCLSLIIFNNDLSPSQQRNLEKLLGCAVIDRTELILDIFAQRARTFEGKLQVELAQLQRLSTRLIRGWTHLERQKGGIGLRGPGETQLETDRRLLRERIKVIKSRLKKVERQRGLGRKARLKNNIPTVALVGYTNVGKSSLFNLLCGSHVFACDQLFATLDPTTRKLKLNDAKKIVLADTVGFIKSLPHQLVAAFRATLEEVVGASLLLHVVDASDLNHHQQIDQVNEVLGEIGAQDVPSLTVYNKIDLIPESEARIDRDANGQPVRVWISVQEQMGIELLGQAISERIFGERIHMCIRLSPGQSKKRAWLYQNSAVHSETIAENGDCLLEVKLCQEDLVQLYPKESW